LHGAVVVIHPVPGAAEVTAAVPAREAVAIAAGVEAIAQEVIGVEASALVEVVLTAESAHVAEVEAQMFGSEGIPRKMERMPMGTPVLPQTKPRGTTSQPKEMLIPTPALWARKSQKSDW
jgi:hypothetical protein